MPVDSRVVVVKELVPLLVVADIQRSLAFYRDRLGFELTGTWEPDGKLAWCRLARGGTCLMLQQACSEDGPATGRGRGVWLYATCDDADAMHEELTAAGLMLALPEIAFYGMKQLFLHDPDGYVLCFQNSVEQAL
jgi:uncharacterized glyoxalase superfamily protein PhnB